MAISLNQLVRSAHPKPPIMTLYGVHGIGKSTFASQAPSPVFIQTEDGLGMLDCAHFPLAVPLQFYRARPTGNSLSK